MFLLKIFAAATPIVLTKAAVPCGSPGHANFGVYGDQLRAAIRCVHYDTHGSACRYGLPDNWEDERVSGKVNATVVMNFYGSNISDWCTGLVVRFDYLEFNEPLTNWNTSSVESMEYAFSNAKAFNQTLLWDVSRVKNFRGMFQVTSAFNSDLSSWDVGAGCDFTRMFYGASNFNQDLNDWQSKLASDSVCAATKIVDDMFFSSDCPNQNDPVLPYGPFCQASQAPSLSSTGLTNSPIRPTPAPVIVLQSESPSVTAIVNEDAPTRDDYFVQTPPIATVGDTAPSNDEDSVPPPTRSTVGAVVGAALGAAAATLLGVFVANIITKRKRDQQHPHAGNQSEMPDPKKDSFQTRPDNNSCSPTLATHISLSVTTETPGVFIECEPKQDDDDISFLVDPTVCTEGSPFPKLDFPELNKEVTPFPKPSSPENKEAVYICESS